MTPHKIKSYAKINLALNIVGKNKFLHKIETIVAFVNLHDEISIKKINSDNHIIKFKGEFSKNINKKNTILRLLDLLEKKKLLNDKKFQINILKRIPNKAGLGGGSMNAASILSFFYEKKIIHVNKKELKKICRLIGSDVILGLSPKNTILTSKNEIKSFSNYKRIYTLIVKPNFGCSTKYIYSKVRKFNRPKLNNPKKDMFSFDYLKRLNNSLEPIVLSNNNKIKLIKIYLEKSLNPIFVRMTGSGSALVAYFDSKKRCDNAKKMFNKKYKNYWCITSKTI